MPFIQRGQREEWDGLCIGQWARRGVAQSLFGWRESRGSWHGVRGELSPKFIEIGRHMSEIRGDGPDCQSLRYCRLWRKPSLVLLQTRYFCYPKAYISCFFFFILEKAENHVWAPLCKDPCLFILLLFTHKRILLLWNWKLVQTYHWGALFVGCYSWQNHFRLIIFRGERCPLWILILRIRATGGTPLKRRCHQTMNLMSNTIKSNAGSPLMCIAFWKLSFYCVPLS